jgi:2-keto-3-deoxy-L-rhamnonate aldolase RhmA
MGYAQLPAAELYRIANESILTQMLIESPRGIANVAEIASLPGVDLLAIGANDLSAELGVAGQTSHASVREAIATALAACRRAGKLLVVGGIQDPAELSRWLAEGAAPLLMAGIDTELLLGAARERVRQARGWVGPKT